MSITTDAVERQRIIAEHMPIVHTIAKQYATWVCAGIGIEFADLVQEGALALIQALNRFDPEMGATFRTYCYPRIRGAVLDFLRDHQVVSRGYQVTKRRLGIIIERYMHELERAPTNAEIAAELGMTDEQWHRSRIGIAALAPQLGFEASLDPNNSSEFLTIGDAILIDPVMVEDLIEQMETVTEIRDAISKLPTLQQEAIRGKFFTQTLARETAERIGVKTERITRLNRQGLDTLRSSLSSFSTSVVQIPEPDHETSPSAK